MARVLVIDDDAGLLQMVKLMLEREGHVAILAEGGEAGLESAQSQSPDIAIIDLMMPGISGYDVTRQLRANPATARIPVMILTARSQPMDKQMAMNAGATAFMSKPVSSRELTARISEILSNKPAGPASTPSPVYSNVTSPGSQPVQTRAPASQGGPALRKLPPAGTPTQAAPSPVQSPSFSAQPAYQAPQRTLPMLPATVVWSVRPGVGGTTLAVNLTFLARRVVDRVCIVDFAPGAGQVTAQLHLQPRASWADLLNLGDKFDVRSVGSVITAHPQAGVGVISSPASVPARSLSAEGTVSLLGTLTSGFQQIFVDVSAITASSAAAFAVARTVVVVVADDMATAQTPINLPQLLANYGVDSRNIRLVVNHGRPEPGVPLQAIAKALNFPVSGEIPFDVNQAQAIRRGVPAAIMAPESPFALSVQQLLRTL
jgi:CheY-like chemotaxis protein